jgi:hypothetical protein
MGGSPKPPAPQPVVQAPPVRTDDTTAKLAKEQQDEALAAAARGRASTLLASVDDTANAAGNVGKVKTLLGA